MQNETLMHLDGEEHLVMTTADAWVWMMDDTLVSEEKIYLLKAVCFPNHS